MPATDTDKVADWPWLTVTLAGAVDTVGGRIAGWTVSVKVWLVTMPLLAVIVTVKGEPVVSGAVPLSTPEIESRLAHDGRPVAE